MADRQEDQEQQQQQHGVQLDHDQFCCSVCLDLLKDPVTIYCGHNYCRNCIEGCWDREDEEDGEVSCPQCRETFRPRPVLRRNNLLAEVVEKVKRMGPAAPACAGPADVPCDFCSGPSPDKATMTCLTCFASYCPSHLEPHYSIPALKKHRLVAVTAPIQEKMCTKHNKLMEVYCLQDQQLICSFCTANEHKHHKCVPVAVLKDKTKNQLVSSRKNLQEKVQQREEELQELSQAEDSLKCCAENSLKDCDRMFADLISSLQRRRSEVKQLIKVQEQTAIAQVVELQLQLVEEITKLKEKDAELEQLAHVDNFIYLMQIFQSLSTSCDSPELTPGPLRSLSDVTDCVSELRDKIELVLKEIWPRITATDYLPLTLDDTSNYPYLYLMDNNSRIKPFLIISPAHPHRFTKFPQVLCRQGLTERCYWEVEWHARTLSVAVAYKDINRTSDESKFGKNDKSWTLECTGNGYSFRHNNVETLVPSCPSSKIGVFLDYKAGILCFYHASDPMVLIHKVQTTFTQPLYPGLGLNYEWYDTGVFAQLVRSR
ncbi:E3 ubiquitin/ISG15 ligase TRIM25-like isoform X2 [Parambassis ranga]|uniref:E3 ubiquitin/ISG15 ligase TRIM25-like isoform X2 n=1 Tax=Parambassis ranga TaxID=210632 RepID=A0A6P7IFE3_9TELE|nr:E3 ubiquitin/ISG15 ligase TRIM25-like isoform X2 [Parambassis ranga]